MIQDVELNLAEHFGLTAQMEGRNTGMPAYFIRFAGCNLSCGFSSKGLKELKQSLDTIDGYVPGGHDQKFADLYNEGKATWCCDSTSVWLKGHKVMMSDIIAKWKELDIFDWVAEGRIAIIWTGGEPAMPSTQLKILQCIAYIKQEYHAWKKSQHPLPLIPAKVWECHLHNELETNGTYELMSEFVQELSQINCSLKLSNSGMVESRRINPNAIDAIIAANGSINRYGQFHCIADFKFVISEEADMKEINRIIDEYDIPYDRVYLQPGLDRQENGIERTKFAYDMAMKYGYRAGSRFQILMHDQATGI